jgi:hypothetical protein
VHVHAPPELRVEAAIAVGALSPAWRTLLCEKVAAG